MSWFCFNMLMCGLSVPGTGGVSSCSLGPGALLWEPALESGAWTLGLGGGLTDYPVQHTYVMLLPSVGP